MPTSRRSTPTTAAKKAVRSTAATARTGVPSTRRKTTAAPSAVALLTEDHREVEQLFKKFESLGPNAHKSRDATVAKIIKALSMHAAIEELVFYPEVRSQLPEANEDVLEALEEHHLVKWTLSELEGMRSQDERFEAKVTVLMENVRHHVKEEEGDLFPKVRKAFTRSELEEAGSRLVAAKKTAPTRPHPRSPDAPPGNIIATALVAPLDAAANLAGSAADRVRDIVT